MHVLVLVEFALPPCFVNCKKYSETEAQNCVDENLGVFLCRECFQANVANPDPPNPETYALKLVDNSDALTETAGRIRKVRTFF